MNTAATAWAVTPPAGQARTAPASAPLALRAALWLFFFLVPLETLGFGEDSSSITVARLAGLLLLGFSLLRPRLLLRRPDALAAWGFLLMTCALLQTVVTAPAQLPLAAGRYFTWVQMLLLYHIARPLIAVPAIRLRSVLSFLAGSCATALLLVRGAGLNARMADAGRAALGNLDPNVQAAVLGLAAVWLLALLLGEPISLRRPLPLAGWAAFLLLAAASLLTGSRGGLLALLATLAALPFLGGERRASPRAVLIALAGAAVLVLLAAQNGSLVARIERSLDEGDTAGRGYIYASALDMWWRRPLLGWGLGANEAELGAYTNTILRDTHSIYFYALTAGGILGAALLLGMLVRAAREARLLPRGTYRRLALGGLVFALAFGTTVTVLFFKFFWLALLLAAPLRAAAGGGAPSPHLASRMAPP